MIFQEGGSGGGSILAKYKDSDVVDLRSGVMAIGNAAWMAQ